MRSPTLLACLALSSCQLALRDGRSNLNKQPYTTGQIQSSKLMMANASPITPFVRVRTKNDSILDSFGGLELAYKSDHYNFTAICEQRENINTFARFDARFDPLFFTIQHEMDSYTQLRLDWKLNSSFRTYFSFTDSKNKDYSQVGFSYTAAY